MTALRAWDRSEPEPLTLADLRTRAAVKPDDLPGLLGVGRHAIYAAIHDGTIPSIRLGRRIVVPTVPLLRMLGEDGAA